MSIYAKKASKGDLLIAEPFLNEPIFKRSVILLTEYNPSGSVGFILNKPIETVNITDLFKDFPKFESTVYMGGPVNQETLYYIHSYPYILKGSLQIKDNVFIGGEFETLRTGIELGFIKPSGIRFYLGYSGWSKFQLKKELSLKSWIVERFKKEYIFSNKKYNSLWKDILSNKGGDYSEISSFPSDPNLN